LGANTFFSPRPPEYPRFLPFEVGGRTFAAALGAVRCRFAQIAAAYFRFCSSHYLNHHSNFLGIITYRLGQKTAVADRPGMDRGVCHGSL
jgi:hypothetical protein